VTLGQKLTTAIQLREIELKVQREINEKRQELLAKEESLRFVFKRDGTRVV
jgi:hypothetical protein